MLPIEHQDKLQVRNPDGTLSEEFIFTGSQDMGISDGIRPGAVVIKSVSSTNIVIRRNEMIPANKQQKHARHQVGLTVTLIILISTATPAIGPIRSASAQADARGWSYTGSLNTARAGHRTILLPDGKVLVAGGSSQDPRAELYDPVTGTWNYTGSLNTNRTGQSATLLPNGSVLVAGGSGSDNRAELYDPEMGTWSYTGSLNTNRGGHTATLLQNGKVLVVGGNDFQCSPLCNNNLLKSAELYDPATGAWSITGTLVAGAFGIGRTGHTATLLQSGKVLVSGGWDSDEFGAFDTELYDPTTGTWSVSGRNNIEHAGGHTATLLPNSNVLIAGACTAGIFCGGSSTELYNPATGSWSVTGRLNIRRLGHTTTLLPNGKVLVTGGSLLGSLVTSELYDPDTGTWSFTDNLNTPRSNHTATLLPDGKVLIVGGYGSSGILDSVELGHDFAAGATPAPRIFKAMVGTRGLGVIKLFVDGENFAAGAVILLNGNELKTKNEVLYPEATLFSQKKAGRKIKTGDHLQVRNPDGALSEVFIFTGS